MDLSDVPVRPTPGPLRPLPPAHAPGDGELPAPARRALVLGVLTIHAAAAWALLQASPAQDATQEASALSVDLIVAPPPPRPAAPPPPPPPPPPAPPPPTLRPVPRKAPPPAPLAAAPTPAPAPQAPAFTAPPAPPEPAPPAVATAQEPAPAPPAAAAPPAPPAPPAEPRTVSASAVQYLRPPAPVYPRASRRQGESGRVTLRVLIDEQGRPADLRVQSSSGHARLDEAALEALREARFRPYAENGVAQRVWALVPIHFDLEN